MTNKEKLIDYVKKMINVDITKYINDTNKKNM